MNFHFCTLEMQTTLIYSFSYLPPKATGYTGESDVILDNETDMYYKMVASTFTTWFSNFKKC